MKILFAIPFACIFIFCFSKTQIAKNKCENIIEFKGNDTLKSTKGKLLPGEKIIVFHYYAISCECAKWVETANDTCKDCDRQYTFLEPANNHLINADTLFNGDNLPVTVKLTGQYYSGIGYPKNYKANKGNPDPAKVFRYTKIEVLSKN